MEKELEKQNIKVASFEKETKEKESKFLDLYLENSQQHDKILELTNLLEYEVNNCILDLFRENNMLYTYKILKITNFPIPYLLMPKNNLNPNILQLFHPPPPSSNKMTQLPRSSNTRSA